MMDDTELHTALLAWRNGDITLVELKRLIHTQHRGYLHLNPHLDGYISAEVKLKFLPMAEPRSTADKIQLEQFNTRLDYVASNVRHWLQSQSITELEMKMKR